MHHRRERRPRGSARPGVIAALIAVLLLLVLAVPSASARRMTAAAQVQRMLANPPQVDRPSVYWWWPGSSVSTTEVDAEIAALKHAGFGAAQIVDLEHFWDPGGQRWQWESDSWVTAVSGAVAAGLRSGVRLDIAPYPVWPMSSPAVSGANMDLSEQELIYGAQTIVGPSLYNGPPPSTTAVIGTKRLVAVTAAQPSGPAPPSAQSGTVSLDPRSAIDLSAYVQADGRLSWSVPPGRWLLFGFWRRATGQVPETMNGLSRVPTLDRASPGTDPNDLLLVDPFNPRATTAALRWIDSRTTDPTALALWRRDHGQLYEDSLENSTGRGDDVLWSANFLQEFRDRRGYPLGRYLPALFAGTQQSLGGAGPTAAPDFTFVDGLGARVRHDYYETLTDLFVEHQRLLQRWAHTHGFSQVRHQDYGITIDSSRAQAATGIPDTESLGAGDPAPAGSAAARAALDYYRVAAGAAHISKAPAVNLETGDVAGCSKGFCPYGEQPVDYWRIINHAFAGGITHIQIHGMAYRVPPGTESRQAAQWPGWTPWNGMFSEAWNQDWPQWSFWAPFTTYIARASQILSQGTPRIDLLFYRDNFLIGPSAAAASDQALDRAGYTYEFTDPVTLASRGSVAARRLFPSGPAYKALVIDTSLDWMPGMPGKTAARLLQFARAGLPIVFVGAVPTRGTGARDPGHEDDQVKRAVAAMLALPNVRRVTNERGLLRALARLAVHPDAAWRDAGLVHSVHRRTATRDYWYFWNEGNGAARFTATLATHGSPYELNLWDNRITPVPASRESRQGLRLPLRLGPDQAIALLVDRNGNPPRDNLTERSLHASHGRLPQPIDVTHWQVHVEPFSPLPASPIDVTLESLKQWQDIPALQSTAGTGTYTATPILPRAWFERDYGIDLQIGQIPDANHVSVNGRLVTASTIALPGTRYPIAALLHPGSNVITVRLATPPLNAIERLVDSPLHPALAADPQGASGLRGPVTLSPTAR